jgi:hypothetical protein
VVLHLPRRDRHLASFEVRLSTRIQVIAGAIGVGVIMLLAIVIAAKGGDAGGVLRRAPWVARIWLGIGFASSR